MITRQPKSSCSTSFSLSLKLEWERDRLTEAWTWAISSCCCFRSSKTNLWNFFCIVESWYTGSGTTANWVCHFCSAFRAPSHHWSRYQSSSKLWCCCDCQQPSRLAWACKNPNPLNPKTHTQVLHLLIHLSLPGLLHHSCHCLQLWNSQAYVIF